MVYSLIIWSKQIIAITILLWVQLLIWHLIKYFIWLTEGKMYSLTFSQQHITTTYQVKMGETKKTLSELPHCQVLKAKRTAKVKLRRLPRCLPAVFWASPLCTKSYHCAITVTSHIQSLKLFVALFCSMSPLGTNLHFNINRAFYHAMAWNHGR